MTTLSYTVPVAGSTLNSIADPEVATALSTILTWANGNIDTSNLAAAGITGASVTPSLTGRRPLLTGYATYTSGEVATTLMAAASPSQSIQPVGNNSIMPVWAYLDPANFAVSGKSNTQLILRMSIATNAAAPAVNFTATLNPITVAGAVASNVAITLGSTVSGSSIAINTPAASAASVAETTAFTFPAAGAYVMSVVNSGTTAANTFVGITLQLFALNS